MARAGYQGGLGSELEGNYEFVELPVQVGAYAGVLLSKNSFDDVFYVGGLQGNGIFPVGRVGHAWVGARIGIEGPRSYYAYVDPSRTMPVVEQRTAWSLSYAVQTGFEWAVGPYASIGPLLMVGRVQPLEAADGAGLQTTTEVSLGLRVSTCF